MQKITQYKFYLHILFFFIAQYIIGIIFYYTTISDNIIIFLRNLITWSCFIFLFIFIWREANLISKQYSSITKISLFLYAVIGLSITSLAKGTPYTLLSYIGSYSMGCIKNSDFFMPYCDSPCLEAKLLILGTLPHLL